MSLLYKRIIIVLLILSILFLYFEWGGNNKAFAFQMIGDIFSSGKESLFHPLILLPLLGIIGLLYSLFKTNGSKKILWISILMPGVLVLLTLIVSLMSVNLKMAVAPVVFILLSVYLFIEQNRSRKDNKNYS